MEYTVQQLIDRLNEVEDKNKLIFIEGLSNFGSYYNINGFNVIVDEDGESFTLRIDDYNW